ncbi:MAG: flagellin [Planctomycetes bacterium]|nr:flagellin [Planctomycetota bacterium]
MAFVGRLGGDSGIQALQRNLLEISRIGERLSSGRRINRAADDPAGLAISESLRAQLAGVEQAIGNTQRASSVVRVAEEGIAEVSQLLVRAKELALSSADGSLLDTEVDANQQELDGILRSIDRIAGTTDFAGERLLDGTQDFLRRNVDAAFRRIEVNRAEIAPGGTTFEVDVSAASTQAQAGGTIAAVQAGAATFQVTGSLGTEAVTVADGATREETAEAINAVRESTGVQADATTGVVSSTGYGSASFVNLRNESGTLSGVTEGRTAGTDIVATVSGEAVSSRGNRIFFQTGALEGEALLADGTGAGTYRFTIAGGGTSVQTGEGTNPNERIRFGIHGVRTSDLGLAEAPGGLSQLSRGGAYDLRNDAGGASRIIDAAIADVARSRGGLGALERQAFDSNVNTLSIARENLAAAESSIADTDFARSIAEFIAARIRSQAQFSVLAQRNALAGNALNLLG